MKLAKLPDGSPEIFHTLQGEGLNLGVPAIFIRSSLCNLHCQWCDTDYTWNWEKTPWPHENDATPDYKKFRKEDQQIDLTIAEIAERVRAFPCQHLVLTGGEPLLHQEDWFDLLETLGGHYTAEVETNGTIEPDIAFSRAVHQFNVSPKLANSGNPVEKRIVPAALEFFAADPRTSFKFVIATREDLTEVEQLIERFHITPDTVLLMPEGRTPEALRETELWLADYCIATGLRYTPRLHLHLWGAKRAR